MTCVICDACKKSIPSPHRERNYNTLLNRDLCLDCYGKLENGIKEVMGTKREFHVNEHNNVRKDLLYRMTR
ncbi:MAG: hypothetical protein JEY99_17135 [Spirochaetales bacterium]|nr:hypothetical protein [Spirochaetales bacterium]